MNYTTPAAVSQTAFSVDAEGKSPKYDALNQSQEPAAIGAETDWRVLATIEFMRKNLHRNLSAEEIAQECGLSASRLRHLFKAAGIEDVRSPATKLSLIGYFKMLKMKLAREMLESGRPAMKEVTKKIGVKDERQFIRDFKRRFGKTPAEYRDWYHYNQFHRNGNA